MTSIPVNDATPTEGSQPASASPCPAPLPAPEEYPDGNPDAPYNPPGARNTGSCLPLKPSGEVVHNYAAKGPAPGELAVR